MTTTQTPLADKPRTAAEVLARAKALAPLLRERAEEIERARRLPVDIVEMLRDNGIYRMCFGREWGAPELSSMEQTEVIEALSYGDASVGWCALIGSNSGIFTGFLDHAVAREMYPSPDMITVGMLHPLGRAERVPGGFRLTGRWSFGSGITTCDWVISGAYIYRDGKPDPSPDGSDPHDSRQFLVPSHQVEVIDNWHTTGLAGSGSCDYTITDVFVPEEHTLSFAVPRSRTGPLAAPDAFQRALCGVPLGVTRAALDHFREIALTRVDRSTGVAWADNEHIQIVLGQCEADFAAARHGVYGSMRRQWEVLAGGGTLDDLSAEERIASPLSWLVAFRTARSVVARLYDLLQTWAIHRSSPMDRWLRDTAVLCQHLSAQDSILQTAGAYLLGGKPKYGLALGILK